MDMYASVAAGTASAAATAAPASRLASVKNFFSRPASTVATTAGAQSASQATTASWRGRIMNRLPSLTLPSKQTAITVALILAVGYLLKKVNELSSQLNKLSRDQKQIELIAKTQIPATTSLTVVDQIAQRSIYSEESQKLIMKVVHTNAFSRSNFSTALNQNIATVAQQVTAPVMAAVQAETAERQKDIQTLKKAVEQRLVENTKTATQALTPTVTAAINAEQAARRAAIAAAVNPLTQEIAQMKQTQTDLSTKVEEVNKKVQVFIDASVKKIKNYMGPINSDSDEADEG